jgi:hypothetical protein
MGTVLLLVQNMIVNGALGSVSSSDGKGIIEQIFK